MSMFKSIPVTYPKRRKKKEEFIINEVQEPVRRTMYDIAIENFRALKRVTYMHRIIYAGEHFYQKDERDLEELFHKIIDTVNESYTPEGLTGFLLCYSKYFIHLVEGDEDSINKHLIILQNSSERATKLGTVKLMIHVSHISRRIIHEWITYYGTPAQYLGKININSGLEESARHVYNCIRKTYNLVFCYTQDVEAKGEELRTSMYAGTDEIATTDVTLTKAPKMKADMKLSNLNVSVRTASQFISSSPMDPYRNTLPEYEIVDFVIKTNFTEDIKKFCATYGVVPQRLIYKDLVWPCHMHSIPYDVFSKPYDTITELPKSSKPEEKEKNEVNVEGNGPVEPNAPK